MTRFKDKCVPVTGGSGIGPITGRTALGRGSTPRGIPRGFHPRRAPACLFGPVIDRRTGIYRTTDRFTGRN